MFIDLEGKKKERSNVDLTLYYRYAMEDGVWIKEAESFAKILENTDYSGAVDFSNFYTAGYDSPWKFWNRRNEVMYLANPTVV